MLGNKSFDEILFESLQKFSTVLKVGDLEAELCEGNRQVLKRLIHKR